MLPYIIGRPSGCGNEQTPLLYRHEIQLEAALPSTTGHIAILSGKGAGSLRGVATSALIVAIDAFSDLSGARAAFAPNHPIQLDPVCRG